MHWEDEGKHVRNVVRTRQEDTKCKSCSLKPPMFLVSLLVRQKRSEPADTHVSSIRIVPDETLEMRGAMFADDAGTSDCSEDRKNSDCSQVLEEVNVLLFP